MLKIRNIYTALMDKKDETAYEIKVFEQNVRTAITQLLPQGPSRTKRRTIVNLLKKANFGCVVLEYNGVTEKFVSFSSLDDQDDWQLLDSLVVTILKDWNRCTKNEAKQRFKTLILDDKGNQGTANAFDRNQDTESKILEAVAAYFNRVGYAKNITGTLYLYTDRKPCVSCDHVIGDFIKVFSSIQLTILHGGDHE